jgi:hypothetical protein
VPGAVLVLVGAVLFLGNHIFFPVGVIGQLCLAAGWVVLALQTDGSAALRQVAAGRAEVGASK